MSIIYRQAYIPLADSDAVVTAIGMLLLSDPMIVSVSGTLAPSVAAYVSEENSTVVTTEHDNYTAYS